MARLRFLDSGESHGKMVCVIVEGMPSGVHIESEEIDRELAKRQVGYGRGGRMKIERDKANIVSGVRFGKTLGSPITVIVENRDWENWKEEMNIKYGMPKRVITKPRPGHADLCGALKYNQKDIRNILERSSARETVARVCAGAIGKIFLKNFGIEVLSHVLCIGGVWAKEIPKDFNTLKMVVSGSDLRCADKRAEEMMKRRIDEMKEAGDTVGGVFEIIVTGLFPGLGSHVHWDRKLDARLGAALLSIQGVKGVEIGLGFRYANATGKEVHDEIFYDEEKGFYRKTNNAGGIEGGISNGENIVVRCVMKPIPTLKIPLRSVDIISKKPTEAAFERSDVCAVPSCSVVAEACLAFEIADAFLDKFGGDSLEEVQRNFNSYMDQIKNF